MVKTMFNFTPRTAQYLMATRRFRRGVVDDLQ
jgi:hypothetical protein